MDTAGPALKPLVYIGNQSAHTCPNLMEPFEYALAQHFASFEWFPDKKEHSGWDTGDISLAHRQQIRDLAATAHMRLTVHARIAANPLLPNGMQMLQEDIQLARDIGAVLLNTHFCDDRGVAAFAEAVKPLVRATAEAGLQLAIENTRSQTPQDFNELFGTLSADPALPMGHVGMCLDVGHANLSPTCRNDYLRFVDQLDGRLVPLVHIHLHENWGDADTHLPFFTGPAGRNEAGARGLARRLVARRLRGSVVLEQWPQPPGLLNQARDRFGRLLVECAGAAPGASRLEGG
ncbi:putative endonuclease 4 [Paratrimastix pyriformis]|uniref:Endonuclease 4 n=1 Tax=Paratrimastix pyriformis TaxID=342808 RepID=A0ABQ8UPP8_9EUKA|nr:putative endonuclease 4 [Paratrimastix pyriformis]|eukprot:GAFH01003331.1.p1 GENE.GAFH01003331.1~~GAFH01003331.1.p1  ORF type:complete len:303 (-),score=41.23 GAFH01003331.1:47-919(-)